MIEIILIVFLFGTAILYFTQSFFIEAFKSLSVLIQHRNIFNRVFFSQRLNIAILHETVNVKMTIDRMLAYICFVDSLNDTRNTARSIVNYTTKI